MNPYPPYRQGGSWASRIFLTLATTIFGLSLALNVYLILLSGILNNSKPRVTTIEDGDVTEKVAVIPLTGAIFDGTARNFDRFMDDVEKDTAVKAIVIEIDSPGGTVTASDQIHHRLEDFKLKFPDKPVIIAMGGLAASGGYYVACAGDHIFAQRTTMTGSIGVLWQSMNVSRLLDKWGVEDNSIHSTGADYKEVGSPTKPMSAEESQYIRAIIDQAFSEFKQVVVGGRKSALKQPIDTIANGKIYTAQEALSLGLVDAIGYLSNATQHAAGVAKLKNPMVVRYEPAPSLLLMLGLGSQSPIDGGGASVSNSKGLTINVSADLLRDMTQSRMMYMWNGR